MTRYRLLLISAAAALLAACAQAPTAATPGKARFDGGNSMGSGNSVPTDSTQRGGNSLGSGN
jgi:hypothetical protein